MKAFVTGGTGFIGRRVVQCLLKRGYQVTCLARRPEKAAELHKWGANIVQGDITDRESMRQGMSGADVVFHCAAWYAVGLPPSAAERMERINVGGTENVLGLASELGVSKIVYTSTLNILGDTHGLVIDETHHRDSPFLSVYERTKHQAHKLAERYAADGAPVVIVMPGSVYGPGDHSLIGTFLRLLLRRTLPVMPGADTCLTLTYVDDAAEGHILAAEKGRVGESYILSGDVMTVGDAMQLVARLAGVPAPLLLLDSSLITPLQALTIWLERYLTLPSILSSELTNSLGVTYMGTGVKAERELGYTHRSLEEGMAETVLREAAQLRDQPTILQPKTLLVLTAILFTLGAILLRGRREHTQAAK